MHEVSYILGSSARLSFGKERKQNGKVAQYFENNDPSEENSKSSNLKHLPSIYKCIYSK